MRTGTYTRCAFAIVALLFLPTRIWPQALGSVSPFDGYTAGQASLGRPAGSYALSGFETLNLASGQVNINIPLLTVKGRGSVAVPIAIPLNDAIWDATASRYVSSCNSSSCQIENGYVVTSGGWVSNSGSMGGTMALRSAGDYCVPVSNTNQSQWNTVLTRATFVAPDGTETEFVDKNGGVVQAGSAGYNRGTVFIADNGSFAKFTSSSAISDPTYCGSAVSYPSGTLVLRDGTNYTIINGSVTRIRDRNGNLTLLSSTGVTDSVGHTYQFVGGSVSGRTYSQLQYTGAGGAQRAITVWYAALGTVLAPGESIKTYGQLWPSIPTSSQASNLNQTYDPNDRVSEIDLPDGSRYLMTYNAYGDVAQITLPTGGVIQYDYNAGGSCTSTSPGQVNLMINSTPTPTTEPSVEMCALTRPLKERRELLNGALVSKTDFPAIGEIDHYDVNGTLLSKETHTITNTGTLPNSGTNYNSWQYNQQSVANYYDAGGSTLLKSQTNAWIQGTCKVNCSTVQTVTTTMNGTVKQTAYTYDGYNNVNDQKDYDWGVGSHGALLRETQTSFVTSATYTGINILGLPSETKVLDGSGSLSADTKYGYDAQIFDEPNLNGTYHDNVNFGGNQPRGNVTSVQQCPAAASCAWLTTTFGYDIAGNLVWQTDANNHTTAWYYNDNYSDGQNRYTYAFVTVATNALGQSVGWQYDFGTGQPTIAADINGLQTDYSYNDPLDRLTQTHSPNGANSYRSYQDTITPNTVISKQDQNSAGDAALKSQTLYDGFGRVQETDTFEDASHYIATTQTYDALGRVATTTNPSRPGDGLNYTTTYSYDGLGRPTKTTTPDGAVAATSYTGRETIVTDPAGHARATWADGLGRLVVVGEDPSGLNYTTNYQYDPLGNLTFVTQGACGNCQGRFFTYDSLSRLTSALAYETGTITYTYDNASNVHTRTDARGIVTTNSYDALNRVTGQTYTDGTPTVSYTYDAASVPNSKGHLTSVGNANSTTNYTNFDAVGNVLASSQVTAGHTYPFAYAYNLAGALTSETYPSGRVVGTVYDGANRATAVNGSLNGKQTNYVANGNYWPHGAPFYYTYGNNVWRGYGYNRQLQPLEIYDTIGNSVSGLLWIECPNWGGPNQSSGFYNGCPTWLGTNDNGNLVGAAVYAGGPGPQSSLTTFNETFGYL